MRMRKKQRVLFLVIAGALIVVAVLLAKTGLRDAAVFFYGPTELISEPRSETQRLRIGGLVEEGSVVRGNGSEISFKVSDGETSIPMTFNGVLPDLFREGQGVVAEGYLIDGVFKSDNVLAKHDENYMPPEVAAALKASGQWKETDE